MKRNLNALLPSTASNFLFAIACTLLLALGAVSWTAINSIGAEADSGLTVTSHLKNAHVHAGREPLAAEVTKL